MGKGEVESPTWMAYPTWERGACFLLFRGVRRFTGMAEFRIWMRGYLSSRDIPQRYANIFAYPQCYFWTNAE